VRLPRISDRTIPWGMRGIVIGKGQVILYPCSCLRPKPGIQAETLRNNKDEPRSRPRGHHLGYRWTRNFDLDQKPQEITGLQLAIARLKIAVRIAPSHVACNTGAPERGRARG